MDFISAKYVKQIEYKSFSPEKINHEWIVSTPEVNKLLSEANRIIGELNAFSFSVNCKSINTRFN